MPERQKEILHSLIDKLPEMSEHEKGYLEGTIATAAMMSKRKEKSEESEEKEGE